MKGKINEFCCDFSLNLVSFPLISMMLACFGGHLSVASYLKDHGALLDPKDHGGSNALHWAIDGDKEDIVKWILECGANVSIVCHDFIMGLFYNPRQKYVNYLEGIVQGFFWVEKLLHLQIHLLSVISKWDS